MSDRKPTTETVWRGELGYRGAVGWEIAAAPVAIVVALLAFPVGFVGFLLSSLPLLLGSVLVASACVAWVRWVTRRARNRRFALSRRGVFSPSAPPILRRHIEGVGGPFPLAGGRAAFVVLCASVRPTTIARTFVATSESDARSALDALGVEPRRLKISVLPPRESYAAAAAAFVALGTLAIVSSRPVPLFAALAVAMFGPPFVWASQLLFAVRIVIGDGAIEVGNLFGHRVVDAASLRTARPLDDAVRVTLATGEWFDLHVGGAPLDEDLSTPSNPMALWVASRMQGMADRVAQVAEPLAPNAAFAALARSGRNDRDWVTALREVGAPPGDYRRVRVPEADLWSLVESPTAAPATRVAAAIALRPRLDDDGRARIARCAAAAGDDDVHDALAAVPTNASDEAILMRFS